MRRKRPSGVTSYEWPAVFKYGPSSRAQFLHTNAQFRVLIGGHSDERGTREYNMALGERRAAATMQYLVALGIPRERIEIVSYGEEDPAARGESESSWAQNRRAELRAIEGRR